MAHDLRAHLNDEDAQRKSTIQKLRQVQSAKERAIGDCETYESDLQKKIALLKDLEQETFYNTEELDKVNAQIDYLERQERDVSGHCHEVGIVIERLKLERDDLMEKLR